MGLGSGLVEGRIEGSHMDVLHGAIPPYVSVGRYGLQGRLKAIGTCKRDYSETEVASQGLEPPDGSHQPQALACTAKTS